MRCLVGLVLVCCTLCPRTSAQPSAFGVKGGVRTTEDMSGLSVSSESKRYIVGPTLELALPWHFAFEFDALYRRIGFTSVFSSQLANSITRERDTSWEFPLIVKRRFWRGPARPFVGIGYDPRRVSGSDISSGSFLSGPSTRTFVNQTNDTNYPVTHGLVATGGVDVSAGHMHIAPEVRYVHWNAPFFQESASSGRSFVQSAQDEVFLMLGITWH